MTGVAILRSLGDKLSGPVDFLMFRLERISETWNSLPG